MKKKDLMEESGAIRNSYAALPFQGVWTWLTGKELEGRKPLWSSTPTECVIWACLWFFGGCALSISLCMADMSLIGLIPSIILTAGGARYIVATIIHHAVHHTVFASARKNKVLAEILSTMTWVQPYDVYRKFHVFEHHGSEFSTADDQDLAAIYRMGLTPGKSESELKRTLLFQCFNPLMHLKFLMGRLKSNFIGAPFYRVVMSVVWMMALAVLAVAVGAQTFLLAVALPLILVYQICSILHLVTEHVWVIRSARQSVKEAHQNNSLGRFCGERTPDGRNPIVRSLQWLFWLARHLFWHLPVRVLFVQGSLVVHDWHHRHGGKRDWPNSIQAREVEVGKEAAKGVYSYTDIWGFFNAINYTLAGISQSDQQVDLNALKYRLN
ncbi:fatty acid desaturase [Pseudomonas alliivorans]|nr:fatty acid desaturase [Pseudomonas alliivorans]MEE4718361.1 fatty acid desaturase [Pseudomonas alliivorans]MEE4723423.1 fatty acid desaturase [Pseudomonas alliivorans]MEE4759481.1 fatty acid desaturase [Pseudomonas alliivorans]MEE4764027.1 fatty acid desaturase [Pseudomonas alliivorans]